MTTAQWTSLLWTILIFVGPLVVGLLVKLGQNFLLTRSQATQDAVEHWITIFVERAQQLEPDPAKRKQWVLENIHAMFPKLPAEQVDALIEAILNELKNTYDDWKENGAQAPPGQNVKEPAASGVTFPTDRTP